MAAAKVPLAKGVPIAFVQKFAVVLLSQEAPPRPFQ